MNYLCYIKISYRVKQFKGKYLEKADDHKDETVGTHAPGINFIQLALDEELL